MTGRILRTRLQATGFSGSGYSAAANGAKWDRAGSLDRHDAVGKQQLLASTMATPALIIF